VCFISKGLIEKKKKEQEQNLERGFNPSVGKVKQEQDQQQQQENNKNKRKATTTKQSSKPTKKYFNSTIIQQRNTKASETKQHKIETKQKKKKNARITKQTKQIKERNSLTHSFQNLKYFLHSNLFSLSLETSSLSFCFNLSHTSKPSNQVLIIILTKKRNLALQDNPSIYTHTYKKKPSD